MISKKEIKIFIIKYLDKKFFPRFSNVITKTVIYLGCALCISQVPAIIPKLFNWIIENINNQLKWSISLLDNEPDYVILFIGLISIVIALIYSYLINKLEKSSENSEEVKIASHFVFRDLFPQFYFPSRLGKLTEQTSIESGKDKFFDFPIVSWQEATIEPLGRVFERYDEDQLFNQWIKKYGIYLILGEPGGGKTTLLDEWQKRSKKVAFISTTVWFPFRESNVNELKQQTRLKIGKSNYPLFLFDGWDEASPEMKTVFMDLLPNLKGVVIISCRTAIYNGEFNDYLKLGCPYYLMGIEQREQKRFLIELGNRWRNSDKNEFEAFRLADKQWATSLWETIHTKMHINRISGSPLLLTLLAYMHPPSKALTSDFPTTRLEFYHKAFDWLCNNRIDLEKHPLFTRYAKSYLQSVVYTTETKTKTAKTKCLTHLEPIISNDWMGQSYQAFIAKKDNQQCHYTLEELLSKLKESGVIRYKALNQGYEFLHLTIQEWILAEALYFEQGLLDTVKKYWLNPRYDEVLLLMWSLDVISPAERISTTEYLLKQGCVDITENKPATRSGLQLALKLWSSSDINLEQSYPTVFNQFVEIICQSREITKKALSTLSIPHQIIRDLAKNSHRIIRLWISSNVNTPPNVLSELVQYEDKNLIRVIAKNSNTPISVLEKLAIQALDDNDAELSRALSENINIPVHILQKIVNKNEQVRIYVALNMNVPKDILLELANYKDRHIRMHVAANPKTPIGIVIKYANLDGDEHRLERRGAARNVITPINELEKLANDKDMLVRVEVAKNANTHSNVLERLANDNKYQVRRMVAMNINTSHEVLRELANDKHEQVLSAVANNGNTPADVVKILANYEHHYFVRCGAAMNIKAPHEVLRELANDKNENVRSCIAMNVNTPIDVLRIFADDPHEHEFVYRGVAKNVNTPVDVLHKLTQLAGYVEDPFEKDVIVRDEVLYNERSCLEWFIN